MEAHERALLVTIRIRVEYALEELVRHQKHAVEEQLRQILASMEILLGDDDVLQD